jgi:quercetin dioxygenase-like cupin family protein
MQNRRQLRRLKGRGTTMKDSGVIYTASDANGVTSPEPGMLRQVLAYNPQLMLVRHTFEKGWNGARHSHPHHQMVYVVRGHIRFEAEGRSWDMRSGDSLAVEGDVAHQASALEDAEVLDIFTPYREDYAG